MSTRTRCAVAYLVVLFAPAAAGAQTPVGTSFTYQGRLGQAGAPADGTFDIRFRLFDAASGGGQVGATVCAENVAVTDGVFTAMLDFGAAAFTGQARWLQVGVREDSTPGNCGEGTFTTLSPRQPLSPAPYALHAPGPWAANGGNISFVSGNVGIGTSGPAKLLHLGNVNVPNSEGMIRLESRSGTGAANRTWEIGVPETDDDGVAGYSLVFDDVRLGTEPEMTLKWGTGKLGLGTINPEMSLQVETPSFYGAPALGCMSGPQNSRDWAYLSVQDEFLQPHSLTWNSPKSLRFGTETAPGSGYAELMRIAPPRRRLHRRSLRGWY